MLKLRLSMGGTKKRPVYKIVVADSRFARDGRFIEKLGFFNPLLPKEKKERVGLEEERIKYWLSQGAQCSDLARRNGDEHPYGSWRASRDGACVRSIRYRLAYALCPTRYRAYEVAW